MGMSRGHARAMKGLDKRECVWCVRERAKPEQNMHAISHIYEHTALAHTHTIDACVRPGP